MSQNSQLTRAVVRWQLKATATLNLHWHPRGGGTLSDVWERLVRGVSWMRIGKSKVNCKRRKDGFFLIPTSSLSLEDEGEKEARS